MSSNNNRVNDTTSAAIRDGLTLGKRGEVTTNQSGQTLAYGVMLFHAELAESKGVVTWEALSTSADGQRELLKHLLIRADLSAPSAKAGEHSDKVNRDKAEFNSARMALSRAIKLAVTLSVNGVTSAHYDAKKKLFSVPAIALLGHNEIGQLSLARMAQKGESVVLDNTRYYVSSGTDIDKMVSITATPAQIIRAAQSRASQGAKASRETRAASGNAENRFSALGFESGVMEIAKIIHDGNDLPIAWSDLDDKTRNALEEIRMFIEQAKAQDILATEKSKKVA